MAEKTVYVDRPIPKISLHDFDNRITEITAELVHAAEHVGFFAICNHEISTAEIDAMFSLAETFFRLPDTVKSTVPWSPLNVGWEKLAQIRPSTGAADTKESYQLQFSTHMDGAWISDEHVPDFQAQSLQFMHRVHAVSEKLMLCLARGLGFPDDYFVKAHDVSRPNAQSVMRLLHYFETPKTNDGKIYHRAGEHADWGFLTLLFQRAGQSGLEICPGREAVTEYAKGSEWTKVGFEEGVIVCNIGDLLMSWSDDRFKSTFHRVKAPCEEGDYYGERFSIAFFNQPCADTLIQGPRKKYPLVTGEQFNARAMERQFTALQAKLKAQAAAEAIAKATMQSSTAIREVVAEA